MSDSNIAENTISELDLSMFTGTSSWYRFSPIYPNVKLTDGALYVAENANAFWLMDAIASYEHLGEFLVARLELHEGNTAVLIIEDGDDNILQTQHIPFTDCPQNFTLWLVDRVILLPSEY